MTGSTYCVVHILDDGGLTGHQETRSRQEGLDQSMPVGALGGPQTGPGTPVAWELQSESLKSKPGYQVTSPG